MRLTPEGLWRFPLNSILGAATVNLVTVGRDAGMAAPRIELKPV
jgi:hypothetical protein